MLDNDFDSLSVNSLISPSFLYDYKEIFYFFVMKRINFYFWNTIFKSVTFVQFLQFYLPSQQVYIQRSEGSSKTPRDTCTSISFTRDWPSRGNKPRRIVVNRLKTRPWIVKNGTRENSARILRPGIIQDRIEWEQVPNGEGQRSMVSCFTVIRSPIPTIFHGEIVVGDIDRRHVYLQTCL